MKIAHVGNMANDGYATVKALRENGVDAELLINLSDFGMGLPHWEVYDIKGDPYKMPISNLGDYPLPNWIKVYTKERNIFKMAADLFRATREYDLIHCHFPTFLFQQFSSKPYLIYEAGFLRKIHDYYKERERRKSEGLKPPKMNWERLGYDAFSKSECVTWTNTDMKPMINDMNVKSEVFVPFAIDTKRYSPSIQIPHETLRILHPTRHVWDVKGNDRFLRAFVQFIKNGYKAQLTLVDWGYAEDVAEAKEILAPVKEYVAWVPPMSKPKLIQAYRDADVIADQFVLGASGTTGFEAMSCGKPLMIYFADSARQCFGEAPPCVNAQSDEEILDGLDKLVDENYRKQLGVAERAFVEKHLSEEVVARKLAEIYGEI